MANIPLQSIKFPDLPNIYDAPTMESIGKGIFPELIAGGLVDLDSYVENSVPYLFATMPQGAGKVLTDELVGAKVAWNQLVNPNEIDGTRTVNGLTFTNNGDGSVTITETATQESATNILTYSLKMLQGHKYFLHSENGVDANMWIYDGYAPDGIDKGNGAIIHWNRASANSTIYAWYKNGITYNNTIKPILIDLTQMLGSTTADHIYSLEQGTAGAGVAFFTKYFGNGYRPYDAGSLQGALVSGHKTIGVNQWDEVAEFGGINSTDGENTTSSTTQRSTNFIPVLPNTTYYLKSAQKLYYRFYDADKNYIGQRDANNLASGYNTTMVTPTNCAYFRFVTDTAISSGSICINISNASINGNYYPYEEHTYDIEPVDLNGIFVLDNGELKADGDVRRADGSKDVRYGEVDLGELNWIYYTGGTNPIFQATVSDMVNNLTNGTIPKIVCPKYNVAPVNARSTFSGNEDNSISIVSGNNVVLVRNTSYTDADVFKTAMSGRKLVYPLATPTEDTAEPFEEYQHCNPYGTQEYLLDDSQTVPIPAGHNTKYFEDPLANIMARLDALENA